MLRIRDVYPGSGFFSIPDPGSHKIKRRGKINEKISIDKELKYYQVLALKIVNKVRP
jgi:hypothetical protein